MSDSHRGPMRAAIELVFRRAGMWIAASVLVCAGCGPTPSTVSGAITLDGKPMSIGSDSRGTVVFQPAGGQGAVATGILDRSGQFTLGTGARQDVTPGKYQVAVSVVQLLPPSEQAEQGGKRITPAKYTSAIDSGFQANVVPGENHFAFDMSTAEEPADTSEAASAAGAAPATPDKAAATTSGETASGTAEADAAKPAERNGQ